MKDLEIKQNPNYIWKLLFERGLLKDGEHLQYFIRIEGSEKSFKGNAIATENGIQVDQKCLTPTLSLQYLMRKDDQYAPTINGWLVWRNIYNITLCELASKISEINLKVPDTISNVFRFFELYEAKKYDYMTFMGAGASYSMGVPTQDQLLKNILTCKDPYVSNSLAHKSFMHFYETFFYSYFNSNHKVFPTLEQVYSLIDFYLVNKVSSGTVYNEFYFDKMRAYLTRLILHEIKLKMNICNKSFDFNNEYYRLITNVVRDKHKTVFVTLNYDTLFSSVFSNLYPFNIYLDYGLELENYQNAYDNTSPTNPLFNWINPVVNVCAPVDFEPIRFTVLKLHGSTNWRYCDCCQSIFIHDWEDVLDIDLRTCMEYTDYHKLLSSQPDFLCKRCHSRLSTFIMPPSYIKGFDHPIIYNLVSQLTNIIRKTEKVLFIGYSMPEADVHISAHLHRRKEKLQKSIIVNPSIDDKSLYIYGSICNEYQQIPLTFDKFLDNWQQFRNSLKE